MKPISELTDLEAEKRLTELLGLHWHELKSNANSTWCDGCKKMWPLEAFHLYEPKFYATSFDAIIPVIQGMEKYDTVQFLSNLQMPRTHMKTIQEYQCDLINKTPRELTNAVIEVLEAK